MVSIEVGGKFACVALADVPLNGQLATPVQICATMWLLWQPSVQLSDFWGAALGSALAEDIAATRLFLLATQPATKPDVDDQEDADLFAAAELGLVSVLLASGTGYGKAVFLRGTNASGAPRIRRVEIVRTYCTAGLQRPVNADELSVVAFVFPALACMSRGDQSQFQRVREGLNAYRRALNQYHANYRCHEFVRAVEALVKPPSRGITRTFVQRCQAFVARTRESERILRESYELRSKVEHMHPWQEALRCSAGQDPEELAMRRLRQMDILARHLYLRLCKDPLLRQRFATDEAIDEFWSLPREEQERLWAPPVALTAVT